MNLDITTIYSSLIACLLGTAIAALHLAVLRIDVKRIVAGSSSTVSLAVMSLVRMISVAALLLVLSQYLNLLPLFFLGLSYVISRNVLIQLFVQKATPHSTSSQNLHL